MDKGKNLLTKERTYFKNFVIPMLEVKLFFKWSTKKFIHEINFIKAVFFQSISKEFLLRILYIIFYNEIIYLGEKWKITEIEICNILWFVINFKIV